MKDFERYIPAKPIGCVRALGSFPSDVFCYIFAICKSKDSGGVFVSSVRRMADFFNVNVLTYRRALATLEEGGCIVVNNDQKGKNLVISIPDGVTPQTVQETYPKLYKKLAQNCTRNSSKTVQENNTPSVLESNTVLCQKVTQGVLKSNTVSVLKSNTPHLIKENNINNIFNNMGELNKDTAAPTQVVEYISGNAPSADIDIVNAVREQWTATYERVLGTPYIPVFGFASSDFGRLARQLSELVKAHGKEVTVDSVREATDAFVEGAYRTGDNFIRSHFDLGTLIKQFNSIIKRITDGNNNSRPTDGHIKHGGVSEEFAKSIDELLAAYRQG